MRRGRGSLRWVRRPSLANDRANDPKKKEELVCTSFFQVTVLESLSDL